MNDQFTVIRHHLAPDLASAGAQHPDVEQKDVTPERLRAWLEALIRLAPSAEYPVTPELRIAGPQGRFLVQAKAGQVRVTSWSSNAGGADLTPDRILALVMGTDEAEAAASAMAGTRPGTNRRRGLKLGLMVLAIAGSNGATAWMLTRPPARLPASILPAYTIVAPDRAGRILGQLAGTYETGGAEGDRGLTIRPDGSLRWVQFGPDRTIEEDTALTARAAESSGRPVLVADNFGLIEAVDPITLRYFGDTYRRKLP